MKRFLLCFCLALAGIGSAFAGDDPVMIVLDVEIHVDGERVSTPSVALEPGGDASIVQGVDLEGGEKDGVLRLGFHAAHGDGEGPEFLLDVDFGLGQPAHLQAEHLKMRWGEPYEFVFQPAVDAPSMRVTVTPSRAKRSEFMLGWRNAE